MAEEYYFKSIELAVKTDFIDLTNNIYEGISGLYTQKGDFESALLYFKKSVDLKFKLYSEERVRAFADLEKKYGYDFQLTFPDSVKSVGQFPVKIKLIPQNIGVDWTIEIHNPYNVYLR